MTCLDTTFLIDWLRGRERARKKYEALRSADSTQGKQLSTTIITVYELEKGAKISPNPQKDLLLVHELLRQLVVLEFDANAVDISSGIYSELSKRGQLVGEFDILIAATCIAADQSLVTNDSDFDSITKLTKFRY